MIHVCDMKIKRVEQLLVLPCLAVLATLALHCSAQEHNAQPCSQIPTYASDECPQEGVNFYLYTNRNPAVRQLLHITDSSVTSNVSESYFNASNPTKVIIHGYNSGRIY